MIKSSEQLTSLGIMQEFGSTVLMAPRYGVAPNLISNCIFWNADGQLTDTATAKTITDVGTSSTTVDGRLCRAYDGSTAFLQVDNAAFNLESNPFSVGAVIRPGGAQNSRGIVSLTDGWYEIPALHVASGGLSQVQAMYYSTTSVSASAWVFVMATFARSGGTITAKIYKNGILAATASDDDWYWHYGPLTIGAYFNQDFGVAGVFSGHIADTCVFSRAVTDEEVLSMSEFFGLL